MCQSLAPEWAVCLYMCVCLCMILNQRTGKKTNYVSGLSKLDACCIKHISRSFCFSGPKVPRLEMFRSIISLSKIIHKISRNHPFSQRNKTTEKSVGVEVGGDRELSSCHSLDHYYLQINCKQEVSVRCNIM